MIFMVILNVRVCFEEQFCQHPEFEQGMQFKEISLKWTVDYLPTNIFYRSYLDA